MKETAATQILKLAHDDTILITLNLGRTTLQLTLLEAKQVQKRLEEIFG